MKKALSIFLSVIMILLTFAVSVSAADCGCEDHISSPANSCTCCLDCDNVNTNMYTSCVKVVVDENGNEYKTVCCDDCTGFFPCSCGCPCCPLDVEGEDGGIDLGTGNGTILTDEQQETVIEAFRKVLGRISEFFDNLFDSIFEFLRFDEIMGRN